MQDVLDEPVAPHRASGSFGGEIGGRNVIMGIEAAPVLEVGSRANPDDGFRLGQAQFPWEALVTGKPVGILADGNGVLLDAAVPLIDIVEAVEAFGGSIVEVAFDVAGQRRLIGLEGKQIIGSGLADRLGNRGGGGDDADRDQRTLKTVICRQPFQKHRDGGDLVRLVGPRAPMP